MKLRTPRFLIPQLGLLSTLLLGGCAVGPNYVRPAITENASFSQGKLPETTASSDVPGGAAQHLIEGMDIPGLWWTLFRSPELNSLVEEALPIRTSQPLKLR